MFSLFKAIFQHRKELMKILERSVQTVLGMKPLGRTLKIQIDKYMSSVVNMEIMCHVNLLSTEMDGKNL